MSLSGITRFQFISDVHMEHRVCEERFPKIVPTCPNLIMAGDICSFYHKNLCPFLKYVSGLFEVVVWVPGNHEYQNVYRVFDEYSKQKDKRIIDEDEEFKTMGEIDNYLENLCKTEFPNVVYLRPKSELMVDNVRILGTTLWTEPNKLCIGVIETVFADYRYVLVNDINTNGSDKRLLTIKDTIDFHRDQKRWLENRLLEIKEKRQNRDQDGGIIYTMVVTHHAPTPKCILPKYASKYKSINQGYYTNLEQLMGDPVSAWVCGHSHAAMSIKLSPDSQNICFMNCMGYPQEVIEDFNSNRTLEFYQGKVRECY